MPQILQQCPWDSISSNQLHKDSFLAENQTRMKIEIVLATYLAVDVLLGRILGAFFAFFLDRDSVKSRGAGVGADGSADVAEAGALAGAGMGGVGADGSADVAGAGAGMGGLGADGSADVAGAGAGMGGIGADGSADVAGASAASGMGDSAGVGADNSADVAGAGAGMGDLAGVGADGSVDVAETSAGMGDSAGIRADGSAGVAGSGGVVIRELLNIVSPKSGLVYSINTI